jgi:hypothetical protein
MAKIKITKRTVEALKVTSKDYIAFDSDLPDSGCASCRAASDSSWCNTDVMAGRAGR